ncbi:RNA cytosine-C(5)-methyltransferase NSUN2-like [Trifolium pratense]|uniref:RNA cytosine-C(5)-methyltransferase NSUN2-like n=1 Tax=Trifolium pratense TaxID=57577 RepID=UPI001E696619|nr:RNA cytosine-C(5)-methyltransferase NSUN2-like [Trifolium pratense]
MGRGRGGKSRTQRKHFQQNRENVWKPPRPESLPSPTNLFDIQNADFDHYYKDQNIVSPEEWDSFMQLLRTPLPAAFRINSSSLFHADIRSQLENDFAPDLQSMVDEGDEEDAIKPLPWYPDNFAWHSNFSRMQLRKNQALKRFHEFLKLENEIGNITRQEAVSMVPPLFLDVQSNHIVLDMCAAPGSKTFQLLEILHRSTKAGSLPGGMVIANDLDVQRCNLLIHQIKRMCTANLIVTNHEAQHFPTCYLKTDCDIMGPDQRTSQLLFDRVLCDVPCSGDGTLRKAPDLWRRWNTGTGNGLHNLQISVAMRGLSILKVGGKMVYSTCSMNPIENEAVVAELLRRCEGSVELVDVSSELPQLIRRPGLKRWKVCDKGESLVSCKEVPKVRRSVVLPSMFPNGGSYRDIDCNGNCDVNGHSEDGVETVENPVMHEFAEEVSEFPLERCMRLLPHDQNSGAFFIAVLQKQSPLPAIVVKTRKEVDNQQVESVNRGNEDVQALQINPSEIIHEEVCEQDSEDNKNEPNTADSKLSPVIDEESDSKEAQEPRNVDNIANVTPSKRKLQIQGKWRGVDPVVFFKDEAIIKSIRAFYGIDEQFPLDGHLVTRNSDTSNVKRLYYISKSVKNVLELNFSVGQQLKITCVGLKIFERQKSREGRSVECAFRITSEGLPLILPHITKQILSASPIDFKHLLQYKNIKFADFVDAKFGEKAANLMPGCCVVVLGEGNKTAEAFQVNESSIAIVCWKGGASLTVMVTSIECQELLERLLMRPNKVTEKGSSKQEEKPSNNAEDVKQESNGNNQDVEAA